MTVEEFIPTRISELVKRNSAYAAGQRAKPEEVMRIDLPAPDPKAMVKARVAIVGCMDPRLDFHRILGLSGDDAHLILNAGGVITDDVIRSLCISQMMFDTREVMIVHETGCGLSMFSHAELSGRALGHVGITPSWFSETLSDLDPTVPASSRLEASVRQSIKRVMLAPLVHYKRTVRGFVLDTASGLLREVEA
jgi:carbonic anhydrase